MCVQKKRKEKDDLPNVLWSLEYGVTRWCGIYASSSVVCLWYSIRVSSAELTALLYSFSALMSSLTTSSLWSVY